MSGLYYYLKRGPVMVGEVRGFKQEIGKKFDKSDKTAPPIVFGVFKVHLELLDGSPVMLSIYPDASVNIEGLAERLGLKRGAVIAVNIGKTEFKEGQRKAVCGLDAIHVLDAEEERRLRAA